MSSSQVRDAHRILAREQGAIVKNWGGKLAVALVYPNTYHVGMSSLGFQTIYRLLNARPDVVCERAFWQPRPAESAPTRPRCVTIESQRPIADAHVIAFSLSFEMDYLHMVQVLHREGIPLRASERDENWPAIIVGGPAVSANPLPIANLIDGAVIGEAEEIVDSLVESLWDGVDIDRDALWRALAQLPGVYAPSAPAPSTTVHRQWVRDLDDHPTTTVVHTRDTEFGDMHLIEIARGCGRGCRFCLTGFACRPKREHSVDSILAQAREGLAHRDRIGLVGAAVSDYSRIDTLVTRLRALGARISVSSLRVDPLSEPLLQALAESGTRTLTLAPEAGSERLRQIVKKGVTEADLLHAAERAAHHGFRQVKLYFMLGLPTERDEDIEAIAALCEAVAARFGRGVTANVTPFVPKAHTPLQWAAMTPVKVLDARLKTLRKRLRRRRIDVRGESPRWAAIQGVLARGDQRLGDVLAAVGESTSIGDWRRALEACDIDTDRALGARPLDESLPWSFIDTGMRLDRLKKEWGRAKADAPTR